MSKRKHEIEVSVTASPEQIWDAIATGDGLVSWFAPEASVTPGEGGSITLSWGPGMEGTAPIRGWEPGKRLQWIEGEGSEHPKVVEFVIEAQSGGGATLRLVQSGFGEGAQFDDEFESTFGGWHTFLAMLRYRLERHAGARGRNASLFRQVARPQSEVWEQLLAEIGIGSTREGDAVEATIGSVAVRGTVLRHPKPGYLCLSVDSHEDSVLALFVEGSKSSMVTLQWFFFGDAFERHGAAARTAIEGLAEVLSSR